MRAWPIYSFSENAFLVRFVRFKFGQCSELERCIRYISGKSPFHQFNLPYMNGCKAHN